MIEMNNFFKLQTYKKHVSLCRKYFLFIYGLNIKLKSLGNLPTPLGVIPLLSLGLTTQ